MRKGKKNRRVVNLKKRKIPLRRCVSCGESKPKKELIRVVRNTDDEIEIDMTGKINGRGAYVCRKTECIELAGKSKKLSKSLEKEVPEEIFQELFNLAQTNKEEE